MPEDSKPVEIPGFINDYKELLHFIDGLKLSRVRHFKHPCGLEVTLESEKGPRGPLDLTSW